MKRWSLVVAVPAMLCVAAALSGCGPTEFTSIDEDKPLNQLDADEEVQLCDDSKAYVEETIGYDTWHRGDCMYRAMRVFFPGAWENGEAAIASCEEKFYECLEAGDPREYPALQFCTASPSGWPVGCALTVGDFVECSTGQYDAYVELAELSCSDIDFEAEEAPILPEGCSESLDCADPP